MTTSTRCDFVIAANVFVENDAFTLDRSMYLGVDELSAVAWVSRGRPDAVHRSCLQTAAIASGEVLPEHRLWVLAGHYAPQADTAVSRHQRLWKSLERDGVAIPAGIRTEEYPVAGTAGIRWFGAIEVEREVLSDAVDLIYSERATTLVLISAEAVQEVSGVLRAGWESCSQRPPVEIVRWLAGRDALTFRLAGRFDDPESAVVGFGPRALTARFGRSPSPGAG